MAGTVWKEELTLLNFDYNYADDGGDVGTISLGNLPDNFIVTNMYLYIDTTITSGGTPTIVIGEDGGGDADGYFANFFGTPTAGTILAGGGALISDNLHKVDSTKDGLQMTVGTSGLTAGAFRVLVSGFQV